MAGLNRRFGPATASRKPTSVIAAPAMRSGEIGCAVVPNQPKASTSRPMTICPVTGMITVLRLPSFGSSSTLPVRKVTPNTPANHIHHGPFAAVAGISGYGPSSSVKVSIAMRPTLNDTSEARNGEPMERPSRVFTAVCTGVISPEKIPSNPCSMFSLPTFLGTRFPAQIITAPDHQPT